ncbi:MAG: hypothetical protein J7M14_00080 [Planctomycetes bacterium]|nr:hypothetical protein [Planctomycetota bacterium]
MTPTASDVVIMLLVVESIILLVMILRVRRRISQARGKRLQEPAADFVRLAGEMEGMIRQIDRNLTARLAQLEQLIDQAGVKATGPPYSTSAADGRGLQNSAPMDVAGEGFHDMAASDTSIHREILKLAEEGLAGSEIAARLERPIGEIELVLRLHHGSPADP